MRDTVKRNDVAQQTAAVHDLEATDSRMLQSIGANADFIDARQRRRLRHWFLLANIAVWIGIIALIRWLFV